MAHKSPFWHVCIDVRTTQSDDSQCAHSVVFSAHCAQFDIIATVVMGTSFG
jgi:hypothetical protein